jgi:hypothetical protein
VVGAPPLLRALSRPPPLALWPVPALRVSLPAPVPASCLPPLPPLPSPSPPLEQLPSMPPAALQALAAPLAVCLLCPAHPHPTPRPLSKQQPQPVAQRPLFLLLPPLAHVLAPLAAPAQLVASVPVPVPAHQQAQPLQGGCRAAAAVRRPQCHLAVVVVAQPAVVTLPLSPPLPLPRLL